MTTNTPPTSPIKSKGRKEKTRSRKSNEVSVEKGGASSTFEPVEFSGDSESSRMLRFAGLESSASYAIAKPLLIDDSGLIPRESVDRTFMTLKQEKEGALVALEGSTERLELFARSGKSEEALPYKYAVALIPSGESDPIRVWDAHVLVSEKRVKRLREVEESDAARLGATGGTDAASAAIDYKTAQNLLGEAFGTRKRKQAIVSMEKNRVNADSLGVPATTFISSVLGEEARTDEQQALLSAVNDAVLTSSLLPPFDRETLQVAEIYPIASLIPSECYRALPVSEFSQISLKSSSEEIEALRSQYSISEFWMNRIVFAPKDDGFHVLRLMLFGHFLSGFRELREAAINGPDGSVAAVQSRLPGCPQAVAADLLDRFADRIGKSNTINSSTSAVASTKDKYKLPNTLRDKAILYLLAVLLHLDSFRVNITTLSQFLSLTSTKLIAFFRSLGCTIDRPARSEEANLYINNRLVPVKFARLTAPLTFPAPSKRQGKK